MIPAKCEHLGLFCTMSPAQRSKLALPVIAILINKMFFAMLLIQKQNVKHISLAEVLWILHVSPEMLASFLSTSFRKNILERPNNILERPKLNILERQKNILERPKKKYSRRTKKKYSRKTAFFWSYLKWAVFCKRLCTDIYQVLTKYFKI